MAPVTPSPLTPPPAVNVCVSVMVVAAPASAAVIPFTAVALVIVRPDAVTIVTIGEAAVDWSVGVHSSYSWIESKVMSSVIPLDQVIGQLLFERAALANRISDAQSTPSSVTTLSLCIYARILPDASR